MTKGQKKLEKAGTSLKLIKDAAEKPIANEEKNETNTSIIRHVARVSTLPTLTQDSTGIPSQSSKTGERNKRNSNTDERS
jgi:hypothetical protein